MPKYTVQRTLIIPEDELTVLEYLIKERGWKISPETLNREQRVRDYLDNIPAKKPLLTEEEIREEIKAARSQPPTNEFVGFLAQLS